MNSLARDADDDQQQPRNEPTTAHAQTSSQQPQNPFPPPPPQQQPPCPRCGSTNTKFCYYNNYSLSQPRYICKGCRRYWTHGGSLRNVPVGGGSRKPKRPRLSSSTPATTTTSTESIQVVHQHRDEPTVPTTLTIGDDIVPAATAVLATSVSPPSSSLTYQMVNLINPNYHHQLSCGGVGGFDQGGSFLSSLMAVQSMAGGYTHSFHPSLASSNYHTLISSRNSGSGIFDFSSVDRSHHDDQPRLDFLTSDVQHLQANHTQTGVVSSVDARFWSVGGGGGGEVSRHGDKTNKDEEMVIGGGGSTGGGSSRVPPPQ